jgi:cytochrome c oxidase subunit 2
LSVAFASVAEPAATYQSLFNLYLTFAIIAGSITIGSLILFPILYRRKGTSEDSAAEKKERGSLKVIALVVVLMVATLSTTAYASFSVKDFYLRHPDCKTAICVQVEAFQWAWNFTYPNGKNVVGLLRVPQDTPIVLNVTSSDVFHSFSIQALRIKTDAIRGRYNVIWFNVPGTCPSYGKSGFCEYRIQCFELCGLGHAFMTGRLIVMPQADFQNYYTSSGP